MLNLTQIVQATAGKLLQKGKFSRIKYVSINSRQIKKNSLFVAIKGERFDGHRFISQAVQSGAHTVVVSKKVKAPANTTVILVKNTTEAFGLIAREYRRKFNIPVIAITGSAGKTTTKEILAKVLGASFYVLKNLKTLNNQYGVPLTLLRLTKRHDALVIEFGTNQPGDIAWLAQITEPTMAVFTNIGEAHLLGLKSKSGIFREKASLIKYLRPKSVILFNNDDQMLRKLRDRLAEHRSMSFGVKNRCRFKAEDIKLKGRALSFRVNSKSYTINSFARHNIYNALAAISSGSLLGIPYNKINSSIKKIKFPEGRFAYKKAGSFTVVDDTYNANPLSLKCAVEALINIPGVKRRIVVCADMLELGSRSQALHRDAGRWIGAQDIDHLISFGKKAAFVSKAFNACRKSRESKNFQDINALNRYLKKFCQSRDIILVKGSRSMKMERVVAYLSKNF